MAKFNNNQKRTNNKGNNNRPKTRMSSFKEAKKYVPKFIPTTYTKCFVTFDEAISEMVEANQVIENIIKSGEYYVPEAVSAKMVDYFQKNFPVVGTETQIVSIICSGSRCSLKTREYVAFGYRYKYSKDKETEEITLSNIEAEITLYKENQLTSDFLEMSNWVEVM